MTIGEIKYYSEVVKERVLSSICCECDFFKNGCGGGKLDEKGDCVSVKKGEKNGNKNSKNTG